MKNILTVGPFMYKKLIQSPLTYVLAQVKFTSIEGIEKYVPELQDKIRSLFPRHARAHSSVIQLNQDQEICTRQLVQWHFIDKTKQTGIILDKQTLTIHTTRYDRYDTLLAKLIVVIEQFHAILKFSLITRVGLRYINLIEEGLEQVEPGLRSFQLTENIIEPNQFLSKTETTQFSKAGIIKIQATYVGDRKIIGDLKNIFIPPDLTDVAELLVFTEHNQPEQQFLLLDLDHFNLNEHDCNTEKIAQIFSNLHQGISQGFRQAVGQENLKAWSKQ